MIRQISSRSLRKYMHIQSRNKTWAVTDDGAVKIASMTGNSMEGALKVMRESFLVGENLCKAVDLLDEPGAVEEILDTCRDAAKDGVSLVAVDNTDSVVGVSFNKIHVKVPKGKSYYEILSENSKFMSSKAIFDFTNYLDNHADVYNRYNVNTILEVMYVAIRDDFKQRNISQLLLSSTIEMVKQLNECKSVKTPVDGEITNAEEIPKLLVGLSTSKYAHRCCENVGAHNNYDVALEVKFEDFKYKGRKFSEKIGKHETCRVFCLPV